MSHRLRHLLESHGWLLNLWAVVAAFSTYFSMYMFRKPFTAASYQSDFDSGWDQKTLLISAQVIGYLISKIIGVRVISALAPGKRAFLLLVLIATSHLALLLFAVLPKPLHVAAIFFNGLPLGMVFGLVLGFLEGRRMTECSRLACASFILAGGVAKTLGTLVLNYLVGTAGFSLEQAERWMPFGAGLVFLLPLCVSVWMLVQVPPPTQPDVKARSPRQPMSGEDRQRWLRKHGLGIGAISVIYFLTTILRSLRDDFAPEILVGLGAQVQAADYTGIDSSVAAIVLVINGLSVLVVDNRRALLLSMLVCLAGFATILLSLVMTNAQLIGPYAFMVLLGAGLYLPYVAIHTTVFERMIALTRDRGNLGFLIYLVDSLGYLGYVAIMLLRNGLPLASADKASQLLIAFRWTCWLATLISLLFVGLAFIYFARLKRGDAPEPATTTGRA